MASIRVNIKPEILTWAVTRMGRDIDEYSCEDKAYAKWVNGEIMPTFAQAQSFAKKFLVPFGFLFLDVPPVEEIPIPYFRRRSGGEQGVYINKTIRTLKDRQEWLSAYLRERGELPKNYVGLCLSNNDPCEIATIMRDVLGFPENWAVLLTDENQAIRKFSDKLEDIGVTVCFNGVLGNSTRRPIHVNDCRGFCLVDSFAPFIFVNSSDAESAKLFTLAHEFAHVLKSYSAGFGGNEIVIDTIESETERLCNKVASEFLVPTSLFTTIWNESPFNYYKIAKKFKVSKFVVAIKAKECGFISQERLNSLIDNWNGEPIVESKKSAGHPDPLRVMARRTGRYFLVQLNNALHDNRLLFTEAYRLAGMKGDTFHSIVDEKMAFL